MPWLTRSLGALLKAAPRAYGWGRTRWSCVILSATLQAQHGLEVFTETVRPWLPEIGWVWKRAKLVAKDDDPHRLERGACIRFHPEHFQAHEVLVFADALDMHSPAEGRRRLEATRDAGRGHDARYKRATLAGWGLASDDGQGALWPWGSQK